jgi:hypothetical protein
MDLSPMGVSGKPGFRAVRPKLENSRPMVQCNIVRTHYLALDSAILYGNYINTAMHCSHGFGGPAPSSP